MSEDIQIKEAEVIRLQAGDILVYKHDNHLAPTQYERVKTQLLEMIPEGVNLAILDGGARFAVIKREPEPEVSAPEAA